MNLKNTWGIALMMAAGLASCKKTTVEEYKLSNTSTATWKGYLKSGTFNEGTITVKSSQLQVKDGTVISGTFEMPLSSLVNLNLPTPELKEQLIHHLKTADFFNMALYPDLSFTITSVKPSADFNKPHKKYIVEGGFIMLGKSLPVSFPAIIESNGKTISVTGDLKIDRTKWGMNYATNDTLPDDKFIMPEVDIHLQLNGTRN